MTKLESYMVGGNFFATQFYADVEGHPDDRSLAFALEELKFFSKEFTILGVYPAGARAGRPATSTAAPLAVAAGAPTTGAAESSWPHSSQNFALARTSVPQAGHCLGSRAPQLPQNFAPSRLSWWQSEQVIDAWTP